MNLQTFTYNTFLRHGKSFIEPAIIHKWKESQNGIFQEQQPPNGIKLGGDMRADSPGKSIVIIIIIVFVFHMYFHGYTEYMCKQSMLSS